MKPYQQRVVDEKKELDQKIEKLTSFLKEPQTKCLIELERLQRQLVIMHQYSEVLGERIEHFND
jgi:CHASE3 domain sensor protein